ncbi:MAG TPA: hypothetical protein VLH08_03270 [Acidobacteriota bacterium]|nr:hypothetical protein [Acidobacteriota bacterium]
MRHLFAVFVIVLSLLHPDHGIAGEKKMKRKPFCVSPAAVQQYFSASPKRLARQNTFESIISRMGDVVVVEADPQLLILPNPFDLYHTTVQFQPAIKNRYSYSRIQYEFYSEATDTLTLLDDDSVELNFKDFDFPFGGKAYKQCFINSNGSITFDGGDIEPPNIDNLLDGPPRIAAFFTDLDPQTSGTVTVRQTSDFVTVTWLKVPEFFNHDQFGYGENTFQVAMFRDGRVQLIYSSDITATQALIGIIPGYGRSSLRLVDFSRSDMHGRAAASFIEDFRNHESVDIPALMKSVYSNISDDFDFVTLASNFDLNPVPGAQAFAINVQNEVLGIGNPAQHGNSVFRDHKKYGSAGQLQNITFLGNIHQYPSDPDAQIPDTYTSLLQVLAHEVGHRWLSYISVQADGKNDLRILGRDNTHWSFFLDTDGSFLEGNEISKRGSNSFVTSKPFQGYSSLDLYLMGFLKPEDVEDTFLVEDARRFSPDFPFAAGSSPEPDVNFQGSDRVINIDDIIAANGERTPDSSESQKSFKHLFILITKKAAPVQDADLSAIDLLRTRWESFFSDATNRIGEIDTRLKD